MYGKVRRFFIFGILVLCVRGYLLAAPLEGGYALAPAADASAEQRENAFREIRFRIIAAASKYEKTPYRYGGLDARGMDCSGLVYTSFRDALSITIPRTAASMYNWTEKITTEQLLPGDLVFFKTGGGGAITHVGIYVGGNRFIHSASDGPVTGVMYSGLGESYWARTYAGAGRAFPAANINVPASGVDSPRKEASPAAGAASGIKTAAPPATPLPAPASGNAKKGYAFIGGAIAPSWNGFLADGELVRGVAGLLRLGVASGALVFAVELRPEWDGALDVFRLPITFSLGYLDKFSVFAGPAFSFGDARIKTSGGYRRYSSGSPWLASVGICAAPFAIPISRGELAPYAEFAWQSYMSDNPDTNLNADLCAGFRLSTGLRFTWKSR